MILVQGLFSPETILHQRLYEAWTGKYPILTKRTRMTFAACTEEWREKHLVRVRASTARGYRHLLANHQLPEFGERVLSGITTAAVQAFIACTRRPSCPPLPDGDVHTSEHLSI